MSTNTTERNAHVADELEQLTMIAKEYISILRDPDTTEKMSYAMMYHLRAELGKLVRLLGYGPPSKLHLTRAENIAEAQIGTNVS